MLTSCCLCSVLCGQGSFQAVNAAALEAASKPGAAAAASKAAAAASTAGAAVSGEAMDQTALEGEGSPITPTDEADDYDCPEISPSPTDEAMEAEAQAAADLEKKQ